MIEESPNEETNQQPCPVVCIVCRREMTELVHLLGCVGCSGFPVRVKTPDEILIKQGWATELKDGMVLVRDVEQGQEYLCPPDMIEMGMEEEDGTDN